MSLYFKHILRSVKKSPLQPIIILLTLITSVALFITSIKLAINVYKENEVLKAENASDYDISVTLSKSDEVRLLFSDDVEDVIGSDGVVCGEFGLTALVKNSEGKNSLVKISATDFEKSDSFYKFKFVEYSKITEENVNNSIILSTSTAEKYGIKLGDTFTFRLLNKQFDMRVAAIALPEGVLKSNVGIISIGSISEALANANPAISSLADSIVPYTAIRININDESRVDEFVEKLSNDERLDGKLIVKESENVGSVDFFTLLSMIVIIIASAMIMLISAVVISTSLDLLSKKRIKESALFMLSGANNSQLNSILYLECIIYSIIASGLGILLSLPIFHGINSIFDWDTAPIRFELYDIPIAILAAPIIILTTALIHTRKTNKLCVNDRMSEQFENKIGTNSYKIPLCIFLGFALLFIGSFLLPIKYRYLLGFSALLVFLFFIYFFTPIFVELISKALAKALKRFKKIPAKTLLALQNSSISYPLKHSSRLITVLTTLICTVFICLGTLTSQTEILESVIDCNYIAVGANEKTDKILENMDEVDDTFRVSFVRDLLTEEGTGILGISISEKAIDKVHPDIAPKKIPQKNEIVISSGISILSGSGIGDSFTLTHQTHEYTFKIIEVIPMATNIAFLDASYVSEKNELLCINTEADEESEEYMNISNILEVRGSLLVERDTVLLPITDRIISYGELLFYVVIIAFFTTLLGIANVLFSAYTVRKRERQIYYTVGMTKGHVRLTGFIEIMIIVFISLLLIPIFVFLAATLIDISVNSFGIDLLYT